MICSTPSTKRLAGFVALGFVLLAPRVAFAQDAGAAALFKAGKELASKGQWPDACPKFEASYKRESAVGTLMNLADCHQHTGQVASAWGEWNTAFEQARKGHDDERADLAKRRAEALEPRLPRLKVVATGMQSDLSVWRDDKELDPGEYGVELPVDPGARTITVRRGDRILATKTVTMLEKAHESVALDLDRVAMDHPASAGVPNTGGNVSQTTNVIVQTGDQKPPPLKVVGNLLLGVGLTAVVAGGALEGVAAVIKGSTDCQKSVPTGSQGNINLCSPSSYRDVGTAGTLANIGMYAMIGGGALAVTAIVLYVIAPKAQEPSATKVGLAVAPVPGGSVMWLRGSF